MIWNYHKHFDKKNKFKDNLLKTLTVWNSIRKIRDQNQYSGDGNTKIEYRISLHIATNQSGNPILTSWDDKNIH